jgi:ATP-dependent Lon protease
VRTIPVLGTMGAVVFPGMRCGVLLATAHAMAAVRAGLEGPSKGQIAVFATRTSDPRERDDLYLIGTIAQIVSLTKHRCCGRWVANLRGVGRARSLEYVRWEPFREAHVERFAESAGQPLVVDALASAVRRAVTQLHDRSPRCQHSSRARAAVQASDSASELAGAVADLLRHLPVEEHQKLLEAESLTTQLGEVLAHLHALLARVKADAPGPKSRARDFGWS